MASHVQDFVRDAEAVVKAMKEHKAVNAQRIFLLGHSEGSYIASKVASSDRSLAGIVSLAGPVFGMDRILADQMDALSLLGGKSDEVRATLRKGNLEVYALMKDKRLSLDEVKAKAAKVVERLLPVMTSDTTMYGTIRTQIMGQFTPYLRELLQLDIEGTWRAVSCPVIGLFGEMDKQVLPSNATELLRLQPKAKVQVFPKLNHLFLPSATGSPMEYPTLPKGFDPSALDYLATTLRSLL